MRNRILIITLILLTPLGAYAAPSITGYSGTATHGQSITISGSGFGTKSPVNPLIWAPFDSGSISPSNLGSITSWAQTLNGQLETNSANCHSGAGCYTNTSGWESNNGLTLGFNTGIVNRAQKYYISFWRKVSYTYTNQNLKWLRLWPSNYGYSNIYLGTPGGETGGWIIMFAETQENNPDYRQTLNWSIPTNTWRHEEYIMQFNSSAGAADGNYKLLINGVTTDSLTQWMTDSATSPSVQSLFFIQDEYSPNGSNDPLTYGSNAWYDSVYVDSAWQRVMICDSSSWSTRQHCEIQIPHTTWSDTQIQVQINQGSFADNSTAYLYVVDANGSVNSNGYSITFGSGGGSQSNSKMSGSVCRGCVLR